MFKGLYTYLKGDQSLSVSVYRRHLRIFHSNCTICVECPCAHLTNRFLYHRRIADDKNTIIYSYLL